MRIKNPKNSGKYFWTNHSIFKMKQYGLSEQRIKRVIRHPKRKEKGIVGNTIAVMRPVNSKKEKGQESWKQEVWVMYQIKSKAESLKSKLQIKNHKPKTICIISAWRFPGVSPKRNPVPEKILEEIRNLSSD